MVESKSLSAERAVTMSSIYYADIKITTEGYANAITILLLYYQTNITINQFVIYTSSPVKKFERIRPGVGGFLNLRLREYLPGSNQTLARI
jgi:hypothetical protein